MASRAWMGRVLLVIYTLVNVGGLIYAVVMREPMHAALHAALLIPVGWILSRRALGPGGTITSLGASSAALPGRLSNLEQSIDAVAIEVERISEGQRNLTNLLAEQQPRRMQAEQGAASESGKDRSPS
jgi:hypothetical protein